MEKLSNVTYETIKYFQTYQTVLVTSFLTKNGYWFNYEINLGLK